MIMQPQIIDKNKDYKTIIVNESYNEDNDI